MYSKLYLLFLFSIANLRATFEACVSFYKKAYEQLIKLVLYYYNNLWFNWWKSLHFFGFGTHISESWTLGQYPLYRSIASGDVRIFFYFLFLNIIILDKNHNYIGESSLAYSFYTYTAFKSSF